MLRFAANLSMMFTELPFLDRFATAREAGFKGVEFLFPYDFEAGEIAARLDDNGLTQALFNLPPGNWEAGERGLAAMPGREAEFDAALDTALAYAEALDCTLLHAMAGIPGPDIDPDAAMDTYVSNLKKAGDAAAARGVTILIEPINQRDNPGYFLSDLEAGRRVIEAVGSAHVRLQLDLYHRQVTRGDLIHAIRDYLDISRHVQVANPPERADPGTGEINYPHVFAELERRGYAGWIGCEYRPPAGTAESLNWFEPYRA
ncbi:2-oxo-tetronate isomerase [Microbaculum marinisediminis]|uniref:Hydroxypyruvate isomerase family protein n=1 Tax=Microbaculum marinisediminis TaxID=2931392 RepID=A0AAW5QUA0_9HYPH|nr:2-oxo-tetronate isomerase [Microbaculum sp. A6E488]MCT8970469.1 hydroxypyruvate isomerase family protein [Microbaculum sp. A6E488]